MQPAGYARAGAMFALALSVILVASTWASRGVPTDPEMVRLTMGLILLVCIVGAGFGYITGFVAVHLQHWMRNR